MRLVGAKVPRVEDRRILTGRGHYVDDVHLPRMLHAAFLRSPMAHARITRIDSAAARRSPGRGRRVHGRGHAGAEQADRRAHGDGRQDRPEFYPLVTDKVRFVGDLVAMVVAESRYEAEDAAS